MSTILTTVHVILVALAILAFVAALIDPPSEDKPVLLKCVNEDDSTLLKCETEDKPAGGSAGAYAALIAFITAGLALSKTVEAREKAKRVLDVLIGFGLAAAGYLWIAAEAETHPRSLEIPSLLSVLFVLTAVLVLLPLVPVLIGLFIDRMSNRGES